MSGFRILAPLTGPDPSSSPSSKRGVSESGGGQGGSTGGGGSGSSTGGGGNASGGSDDKQRRRRNTGPVSQIACTECRRARAKCDGSRPQPCSRCISRNAKCIYEAHTKTHKDDLLKEIDSLRAEKAGLEHQQEGLQSTTEGLAKDNEDLQKQSDEQSVILDILANDGHDREIVRRLRSGETHQSIAEWLLSQPPIRNQLTTVSTSTRNLMDVVARVENLYNGRYSRDDSTPDPTQLFTKVTQSRQVIDHLFVLYFTWVHPIHMLFSEVEFKESFNNGDKNYCSSPLVNAICAMACNLLDNQGPEARNRDLDAKQLREGFMKAAREDLSKGSFHLMTSIQAFAVMYLAELSSGKARNASGYLRCAADHLRNADRSRHSDEAYELSRWGIQTMNTTWSGLIYQKPYAPESPGSEVFLNVPLDQDADQWRYYRQPGDEKVVPRRPSFSVLTAYNQAKLFRVVHNNVNVYCGVRGKVTAQAVIECYRCYTEWHNDLPPELRITAVDDQPLPHILYLHIQYHTALVQLFTPLVLCQRFSGQSLQEIQSLIAYHARCGLNLLEQAKQLYSCRYHVPLVEFCTILLGHGMIHYSPNQPPAAQTVQFCLDVLQQGSPGFSICGPLQQMFCDTAKDLQIPLPSNVEEMMGPAARFTVDDLLDACTRLSYAQPIDEITRYIDNDIQRNWSEQWQRLMPEPTTQHPSGRIQINTLLND